MSTTTSTTWLYLERRPDPPYRQLFLKGCALAAHTVYNWYRDPEYPEAPEEIARTFDLPLEAVQEAIAYGQSNPPEIQQDREMDDARIKARLLEAFHATTSLPPKGWPWAYLDRKPGSRYRQLFIKGRGIRARTLGGKYMSEEEPETIEEIAANYDLPVEAVVEALAYCSSEPPEIRQDWEAEEALEDAMGMKDPEYKKTGKTKRLTVEEMDRLSRL